MQHVRSDNVYNEGPEQLRLGDNSMHDVRSIKVDKQPELPRGNSSQRDTDAMRTEDPSSGRMNEQSFLKAPRHQDRFVDVFGRLTIQLTLIC